MSLAAALRERDVARLPSRRDEDWRWTDLRGLIRTLPPPAPAFDGDIGAGPFGGLGEAEFALVNGVARGDANLLILPAGAVRTVRLRLVAATAETAQAAGVKVRVGQGARLTLLESHEGLAEGYVYDVGLDVEIAEGGVLERLVIADDAAEAVRVVTATVVLAAGGVFSQTCLTGGARRQRLETRVTHPGAGARARMDGVYLLAGQRHADLTSAVVHAGVGGTTDQLTKGVVADQARGVFQGRIVVAEGADQTDARMGHHALILSDRAEVDAKPELEIYADDVACAHGNTVGALDEEALFYARQRGIPEPEARAMLTQAFIGEVVDRITDGAVREAARAWAAERLGGVHGL
ncbi:MAG: Fe-S cluster assembly protein SufD [Phenylobacterium sp.]|uniref:Fe-S cluster assembly protein SufD n=1 Tax=Phenylobacterium sp. TaxID=1871053 RepID=UPI003918D555